MLCKCSTSILILLPNFAKLVWAPAVEPSFAEEKRNTSSVRTARRQNGQCCGTPFEPEAMRKRQSWQPRCAHGSMASTVFSKQTAHSSEDEGACRAAVKNLYDLMADSNFSRKEPIPTSLASRS